ncbi:MAG: DNA cytosine methyltransferase [Selenomonadaceae bacterium]|nr:DNA cytosine methyltransferase [Selenomonadaceae bacterium]
MWKITSSAAAQIVEPKIISETISAPKNFLNIKTPPKFSKFIRIPAHWQDVDSAANEIYNRHKIFRDVSKIFKALSLFSGAGGMDLGVLQAGFEIAACVECDKFCCETLRETILRSSRSTKVFQTDIRQLELSTLNVGRIDLLFGGSPCQAFSLAGKKLSLEDERGELLFEFIRFAHAIKPRAIMVEQVKGILTAKDLTGKVGGVFETFVHQLENLGYVVKWQVLSAVNFGVAQRRDRIFLVASTNDKFSFPSPTHGEQGNLFLPTFKTVGEVIQNLPPPKKKFDTNEIPLDSHFDITPPRDCERIHGVPEGKYLSSQTHLPKEQIGGLTKKDTTKFLRLDRNKPANTLRGGEIFFHPTEDRYLTPREYMRIHGYPDDYVLCGPIRGRSGTAKNLDQYRQISNSVPPPLAKAVAEKILEVL